MRAIFQVLVLSTFTAAQYQYVIHYEPYVVPYAPRVRILPDNRLTVPLKPRYGDVSTRTRVGEFEVSPGQASSKPNQTSTEDYEELTRRVQNILTRSFGNLKKSEINAETLMLNNRSRGALKESVEALDKVPRDAKGSIYQAVRGVGDADSNGSDVPAVISENLPLPGFAKNIPTTAVDKEAINSVELVGRVLEHKRETPEGIASDTAGRVIQVTD